MNRIVLIGNGFDKAHGLLTGYDNFIEYYWQDWIEVLSKSNNLTISDKLCTFSRIRKDAKWATLVSMYRKSNNLYEFLNVIDKGLYGYKIERAPFLKTIEQEYKRKGWVDIENEYYTFLTAILDGKYPKEYPTVAVLNEQLNSLKKKLIIYLNKIKKTKISEAIVIPSVLQKIYEPFKVEEISVSGREKFKDFLRNRWNDELKRKDDYNDDYDVQIFSNKIKSRDIREYIKSTISDSKQNQKTAIEEHLDNILYYKRNSNDYNAQDYFLFPDDILILTFNYTNTAELYAISPYMEVNHIHGDLTNPDGIIFGYGDDTDDDYVRIEKLNDNAYMTNIKAFNYLGSVNYRHMLEFIEAAPFQVQIMGHSCGTSDRTLLNTLFEHDNCISIKPYYYQKNDGSDDYMDKVQNISRNFRDKKMMRDKVVNKKYCEPLVKSNAKN